MPLEVVEDILAKDSPRVDEVIMVEIMKRVNDTMVDGIVIEGIVNVIKRVSSKVVDRHYGQCQLVDPQKRS